MYNVYTVHVRPYDYLQSEAEKDLKMWHDFDIFFITIQSPADILAHQLIQTKEIGRAS